MRIKRRFRLHIEQLEPRLLLSRGALFAIDVDSQRDIAIPAEMGSFVSDALPAEEQVAVTATVAQTLEGPDSRTDQFTPVSRTGDQGDSGSSSQTVKAVRPDTRTTIVTLSRSIGSAEDEAKRRDTSQRELDDEDLAIDVIDQNNPDDRQQVDSKSKTDDPSNESESIVESSDDLVDRTEVIDETTDQDEKPQQAFSTTEANAAVFVESGQSDPMPVELPPQFASKSDDWISARQA